MKLCIKCAFIISPVNVLRRVMEHVHNAIDVKETPAEVFSCHNPECDRYGFLTDVYTVGFKGGGKDEKKH